MGKDHKKREKVGRYYFDLVVREGNTPIMTVKEQRLSALDEVLETMKKKM